MLEGLIKKVLSEYQQQKTTEFGKTDFMDIVNHDIPELLKENIEPKDQYKIYGSCGTGAWAETPWVAILNRDISTSTQNGYYIVYLFNTKDQILYLTLAVGWTQFQENFSNAEARKRIEVYGKYLAERLGRIPTGFFTGPIDLKGKLQLTKGYEVGQIISKGYPVSSVNEVTLYNDLHKLLTVYDELASIAGDSILNIDYAKVINNESVTNLEKNINKVTLIQDTGTALEEIRKIITNEPPPRRETTLKRIIRNPKIALLIKIKANYICELCGTPPFIQKNGRPYAEADHITPLGGITQGLDTPDNLRCLCAQCHAIVTHGSEDEIRKILK